MIPADPLQAFVSRLVEDHADEWMWRPALHYRWSYSRDAHLLSHRIVEELNAVQGSEVDLGGYYQPDDGKAEAAMRPSATLNGILG